MSQQAKKKKKIFCLNRAGGCMNPQTEGSEDVTPQPSKTSSTASTRTQERIIDYMRKPKVELEKPAQKPEREREQMMAPVKQMEIVHETIQECPDRTPSFASKASLAGSKPESVYHSVENLEELTPVVRQDMAALDKMVKNYFNDGQCPENCCRCHRNKDADKENTENTPISKIMSASIEDVRASESLLDDSHNDDKHKIVSFSQKFTDNIIDEATVKVDSQPEVDENEYEETHNIEEVTHEENMFDGGIVDDNMHSTIIEESFDVDHESQEQVRSSTEVHPGSADHSNSEDHSNSADLHTLDQSELTNDLSPENHLALTDNSVDHSGLEAHSDSPDHSGSAVHSEQLHLRYIIEDHPNFTIDHIRGNIIVTKTTHEHREKTDDDLAIWFGKFYDEEMNDLRVMIKELRTSVEGESKTGATVKWASGNMLEILIAGEEFEVQIEK